MKTHKEYLDKQLSNKKFADGFSEEKRKLKMNKEAIEKVNAMTDEELRIRAAELMEWEEILAGSFGDLWGYKAENDTGFHDRDEIPDWPLCRAAAWELVDMLESLGYETIIVNCAHGNLKGVRIVEGVAAPFPPKETLDHPVYFAMEHALANAQDVTVARAITKAFIIAMEEINANV